MKKKSELSFVVSAYGICIYHGSVGKIADAEKLRIELLEKENV